MSEYVETKKRSNFVAALQVLPPTKPSELMPQAVHVVVDNAFQSHATNQESATPIDRSIALVIRLGPVTAIWLILACSIAYALDVEMIWGFIGFSLLTYWSYSQLDAAERYDSPVGVEHHRIEAAERLASQKMGYDAQIRLKVVQDYLKLMGGNND